MSDLSLEEVLAEACQKLNEGCFEDALERFDHYLLFRPEEAKAYYGRGMAHFQLKKWPDAINNFKKADELDPEDLESWVGLAMSLAGNDEIYEAIKVFETLLTRHPQYVRGHIQLGQLYYRLGVISKGHAQMDRALNSRPSLSERRLIEQLQKEQKMLDKKRYYRPDFEELRKQNKSQDSFIEKVIAYFNRK